MGCGVRHRCCRGQRGLEYSERERLPQLLLLLQQVKPQARADCIKDKPTCLHRLACWTLWCLGAASSRRCLAWSLTS